MLLKKNNSTQKCKSKKLSFHEQRDFTNALFIWLLIIKCLFDDVGWDVRIVNNIIILSSAFYCENTQTLFGFSTENMNHSDSVMCFCRLLCASLHSIYMIIIFILVLFRTLIEILYTCSLFYLCIELLQCQLRWMLFHTPICRWYYFSGWHDSIVCVWFRICYD